MSKKTNPKSSKLKIFLVDDDALFLKSLEIQFLLHTDFSIETCPTGELCLEKLPLSPDVVILDYRLDGIDKIAMNGIETLDAIKAVKQETPVIMLSAQDSIDVAVNCLHHNAFDYVVKSETAFMRLQKTINTIILYKKMEGELSSYMKHV